MFLLNEEVCHFPSEDELQHLCQAAARKWIDSGRTIEPFEEKKYEFVHMVPLPSDIFADSTAESHELISEIHEFNRHLSPETANEIIKKCIHFKTIDPLDRKRLLCFLIHKPNLHTHQILGKQMDGPKLVIDEVPIAPEPTNLKERKDAVIQALANSSFRRFACSDVLFEPVSPSLSLKQGSYESYLTVVLNIFTGKVTAHTDLIYWKKHTPPSLCSITEGIWRQIQNGCLELHQRKKEVVAQLSSDIEALIIAFGGDKSLNLQKMDPHLFTLKGIEQFVIDKFTPIKGVDSLFLGSIISQTLVGLISLSRPMDTQVLGIGADHDGTVTHCHTGNAFFYRVHVSEETQRDFDTKVRRYAEFLQGPMQSMMNASKGIVPELTSAFIYGGDRNLSFNQKQLQDTLYQTFVAEVASDLLPHPLDLFSHCPSGWHKQYSKVIVGGIERLIESQRGCYRANGKPVPYVIYPGTMQPVPFNSPSSEACGSTGFLTNPINPMDHRALQHGMSSGNPIYENEPFDSRIRRDCEGKGQTISINRERQYELKGFVPNNLVKCMTMNSHSCSSFVFLMLHASYFATHAEGFEDDMDVVRAQFLPKVPFEGFKLDPSAHYGDVRMDFQKHAVTMIESIWEKSMTEPLAIKKYEEEILPFIIASKMNKRLSRLELCKIRTLSQLHCLQSEKEIDRLGKLINWFFPIPSKQSAFEIKELLTAAFAVLVQTEPYQNALKQVKMKFDISPENTSPGLILDKFEREALETSLPKFPLYMARLSKITARSLQTSFHDSFGYQTNPSCVRGVAVDVGPKSLGALRRIAQAICTPVHMFTSCIGSRKCYNRSILKERSSLTTPKHVSYAADVPVPNWRSEQIEAFERSTFSMLCDLIDRKTTAVKVYNFFDSFLNLDEYSIPSLFNQLKELEEWKEALKITFPDESKLKKALEGINLSRVDEKSLQEEISKGKKILNEERKKLVQFERCIYQTMDLLRDIMLSLKTVYLEENTQLCERAGPSGRETARNLMRDEQESLLHAIRERKLWTFAEWKEASQIPPSLQSKYEVFYEFFENVKMRPQENIIDSMICALNELVDAVETQCAPIDPVAILDYPLFHVVLVLLDQGQSKYLRNPTIAKWMTSLFLLPTEDFRHFLEFIKGRDFTKKLKILKECLLKNSEFSETKPESFYLLTYFIHG
ncbi:MAG: hypothetical protein KDK72_06425 [Chlamydiia bacterium]|nr:hypothetical protein [Chlamydiia bacterium]